MNEVGLYVLQLNQGSKMSPQIGVLRNSLCQCIMVVSTCRERLFFFKEKQQKACQAVIGTVFPLLPSLPCRCICI